VIDRDSFPFHWTATVDTLLGDDISVDLARSFLVDDTAEGGWIGAAETVFSMAWFGRVLLGPGRRLVAVPTLCSDNVGIESVGGVLCATLHLRTPRSTWALFAVSAGILVWNGAWTWALLALLAPVARSLVVLEIWKWQVRAGIRELESLRVQESDPTERVQSAEPPAAMTRSASTPPDPTPEEIDQSDRWPDPDLASLLEDLSRPGVRRVLLATWDGEEDERLRDVGSVDEFESRILEEIAPLKLRLDTLLGPSTTIERPRQGPGEDELQRHSWPHAGTNLYLVLRSLEDWFYTLSLENHHNRIRL